MGFKFYVEQSRATGAVKLAIRHDAGHGAVSAFVQRFVLKSFDRYTAVPDDETFALVDQFGDGDVQDFLQAAADAAWEIGIRPAGAKDMTSEVAAVRYHLEDMRRLALPVQGAAK